MTESLNKNWRSSLRELQSSAIMVIVLVFGITLIVYWGTFRGMADIWLRSDTFAHGLIVLPVFLYLLFLNRRELKSLEPEPFWPGLFGLVMLSGLWAIAHYLGVNAAEQFAVVAMIPVGILSVAGLQVVSTLGFPLLFLFFAVPFGEFLIPALMEITADFTTLFLQLTGFPVYRTGLFIAVPGGDFEIAKACSGIRYLIASVVLGTLFAYLTFNTWRKRLIFMVVSALVPIVANGLRAYLIVVLASLSGMKLAVGVDHFIYGWVFFGLVMFILFAIGVRFRDELPPLPRPADIKAPSYPSWRKIGLALPAILVAMLIGPSLLAWAAARADSSTVIRLPAVPGGWEESHFDSPWQPFFEPADQSLRRAVVNNGTKIYEFVDVYNVANGGVDAASSTNQLVDNDQWRVDAQLPQSDRHSRVVSVRSSSKRMFVISWYQNGLQRNSSAQFAKLAEARDTLLHGGRISAIAVLAIEDDGPESLQRLLGYGDQFQKALNNCLQNNSCKQ